MLIASQKIRRFFRKPFYENVAVHCESFDELKIIPILPELQKQPSTPTQNT